MCKKITIFFLVCCLFMVYGCSKNSQNSESSEQQVSSILVEDSAKEPSTPSYTATLYIGSSGNFQEYPKTFDQQPTADTLIAAISELTGWNLDLAEPVTLKEDSATICFSKNSALFSGPPEPQKEEFFMYSADQLDATILDSIQRTLQDYFTKSGTLSNLEIYYCTENNEPLVLSDLGITIPSDQPYNGFPFESMSTSSESASSELSTTSVNLYIGAEGDFISYPVTFPSPPTAEELIQAIEDLTGWDIPLADAITSGKGGMTVCFAENGSLFVGPPEPQKEEFFVYSTEELSAKILDSIRYTFQNYFIDVSAGGDPSNLDIYYCMGDNQPLTLPTLGITLPIDQPYTGLSAYLTDSSEDQNAEIVLHKTIGKFYDVLGTQLIFQRTETIDGETCSVYGLQDEDSSGTEFLDYFAINNTLDKIYRQDASGNFQRIQ